MPTRRRFLATLPAAAAFAQSTLASTTLAAPTLNTQRAFLSTTGKDGKGIFTANFDPKTGTFDEPAFATKLAVADFIALSPKNKRRLYATCTVDGSSAVAAFNIVDGPNPLQEINQQTANGVQAVYLSLDPTGHIAMEANYGSGGINTYTIDANGALSPAVEHIVYSDADHGPTPRMQDRSRSHSILTVSNGRFVLVNDYGTDRIYVYRLDSATGKLTPNTPPFWTAPAGTAPRHLAVHPNGKWIYNINEVSNTVDLLLWDAKAGTLTLKSTVPTLPEGHARSFTSDLMLSPDSRFLYAANRGVNDFTVWSVQRDGALQQIQFREQTGAQNRQFCVDATGRWFIAANVGTGDITVFPRDPKAGTLGPQSSATKLPGACFTLWA